MFQKFKKTLNGLYALNKTYKNFFNLQKLSAFYLPMIIFTLNYNHFVQLLVYQQCRFLSNI